jgi:hypothetical protein
MKLRFLTILLLLLSCPFIVYKSAIFANYGLRDDYSLTREAREEPGKIINFTASHGRPLYGLILQAGYTIVDNVDDFVRLRFLSAILFAFFGVFLYRQLRINGWGDIEAAAVCLLVVCLPASQVTVSWAVGWPWGFSLIMTVFGFGLCHRAWREKGFATLWRSAAAIVLYVLSTFIYQSNTLFAVVLLASVLLSPRSKESEPSTPTQTGQEFVFHLAILFVALILGYGLLKLFFMEGVFHASGRLEFETDPVSKVIWFFSQPIPNAMAFLSLRDDFGTGAIFFWSTVVFVLILVGFALYKNFRNKIIVNWLLCILVLPWVAHGISLLAAERATGYRTTFALSGLFVVLLLAAIREVKPGVLRVTILTLIIAGAAIQAHQQSYHLIAEPQAREWNMVKDVVFNMEPGIPTEIYMIEPKPIDRSTDRVFRDEFGSFTSNSSWAPDEMFKLAMHQRFPKGVPAGWIYSFYHGGDPPPATEHYDKIIDMRMLKQWRK